MQPLLIIPAQSKYQISSKFVPVNRSLTNFTSSEERRTCPGECIVQSSGTCPSIIVCTKTIPGPPHVFRVVVLYGSYRTSAHPDGDRYFLLPGCPSPARCKLFLHLALNTCNAFLTGVFYGETVVYPSLGSVPALFGQQVIRDMSCSFRGDLLQKLCNVRYSGVNSYRTAFCPFFSALLRDDMPLPWMSMSGSFSGVHL